MGARSSFKNINTYANRGMTLEADLKASNDYYLVNDIAVIYKKPTPITISKVNYPSRVEAVIKEVYFKNLDPNKKVSEFWQSNLKLATEILTEAGVKIIEL